MGIAHVPRFAERLHDEEVDTRGQQTGCARKEVVLQGAIVGAVCACRRSDNDDTPNSSAHCEHHQQV
jgi:hypothetical protein